MASIYRRGDVWYSRFQAGGRTIRVPLSRNERQARQLLKDLVEEHRPARRSGAHDTTWKGFLQLYWRTVPKAPATVKRERAATLALGAYRPPRFLYDVTPLLLSEWSAARLAEGKGPATVNRDVRAIRAIYKHARKLIPSLPGSDWSAVAYHPESRGRVDYLTADQLAALLQRARGPWHTIVRLGAQAGLRRAEIYWLRWEDIDLARRRLHLTPKYDERGRLLWKPKNYENKRVPRFTPMNGRLLAYLTALPRAGEWVLGPDRPSLAVITAYMRKLLKKLRLPGSVHVLRHSFCSHLAMAGVSPRKIQDLARHASLEATEIYMHLAPESLEPEVERLPVL